MRITESTLRRIIRSVIVENEKSTWINRGVQDQLDGSIDFSDREGTTGDLFQNIQSFIKNDIETYGASLTGSYEIKVSSLKWLHSEPKRSLVFACYPGDLRKIVLNRRNKKEVSFEIASYPLTWGENPSMPNSGLTQHQIRAKLKLGVAHMKNEFSAQEFQFKCTSEECADFNIRVYREEEDKGKNNIFLEIIPDK